MLTTGSHLIILLINSGRIILFYQSYPEKLPERSKNLELGYDGTNIVGILLIYSDNDGLNWSKPRT